LRIENGELREAIFTFSIHYSQFIIFCSTVMAITLNPQQARRIAQALRRGGIDSLRIADALDVRGRTHFLIEVSDMGQFAQDWNALKQIIKQKDDALDKASAQLATNAQQIAALQQQIATLSGGFDAADQQAAAELHQVVSDEEGTPPAAAPDPALLAPAPIAASSAVTTFTK
jgi:methyl-accepting chemotaxis protein